MPSERSHLLRAARSSVAKCRSVSPPFVLTLLRKSASETNQGEDCTKKPSNGCAAEILRWRVEAADSLTPSPTLTTTCEVCSSSSDSSSAFAAAAAPPPPAFDEPAAAAAAAASFPPLSLSGTDALSEKDDESLRTAARFSTRDAAATDERDGGPARGEGEEATTEEEEEEGEGGRAAVDCGEGEGERRGRGERR